MTPIWSDDALADIRRLTAHALDMPDDPFAAENAARLVQRLVAAGDGLRTFPLIGKPMGTRRKLVVGVYCMFYRIRRTPLRIDILRVRHGKELPFGFEDDEGR
ncbi:MAG: type II toxin-antitoxin system RelE/ParE family toxin [Tagaea sp.]